VRPRLEWKRIEFERVLPNFGYFLQIIVVTSSAEFLVNNSRISDEMLLQS